MIKIGSTFQPQKTSDLYLEVKFTYGKYVWHGALPIILEKQGFESSEDDVKGNIEELHKTLNPDNRSAWIRESDSEWSTINQKGQTYLVLKALYSGEWECRVHGPVPAANPQPAARISNLKKNGYAIASLNRTCSTCGKKTMHDLLVMLPRLSANHVSGHELRSSMSDRLKHRIKVLLRFREACFYVRRSAKELIIDHKFPSQRWSKPESPNPDTMPPNAISAKFQLLTNQTNMWKARHCDYCVKTGERPSFFGVKWFYKGTDKWVGEEKDNEKGCVGCPWYDLEEWRTCLNSHISSS